MLIPAFNAAETIDRALDSVSRQGRDGLEVVVCDDGSSDGTAELVERRRDLPVRLVRLNRNRGVAAARNAGLPEVRGRFVAFLDADDEWLEGKLDKQLALFQADSDVGLVGCDYERVFANGEPTRTGPEGQPVTGPEAWRALLSYPFLLSSAVVMRRSLLARTGGFDESLRVGEDQDLWIRAARLSHVGYVRESLVRKHEREDSLSSLDPNDGARYLLPVIQRHVADCSSALSRAERRAILGERIGHAGRNAYYNGRYGLGLRLICKAIWARRRPLYHLLFLLKGPPPMRAQRQRLERLARRAAERTPVRAPRSDEPAP